MIRLIKSLVLRILIGSCTLTLSAPAQSVSIAFVDVNVVPMDREVVLAHHTVLVKDGKIVALGPNGSVTIPRDAQRIDGRNRYLMPGLADMHMHFMRPMAAADKALNGSIGSESPNFAAENRVLALLFVANESPVSATPGDTRKSLRWERKSQQERCLVRTFTAAAP